MSVDLTKIKPGDQVTVRCTVIEATLARAFKLETADGVPDVFEAYAAAIVSHTPKALAVGDRVKSNQYGAVVLTILAIDDEWAWLRDGGCWRVQCPLSGLERVDA